MDLPIEISPNPLVISSIELRFSSQVNTNTLFPSIYNSFSKILPNFEPNYIPPDEKKNNPKLKYAPDYTLSNESYKLSFSNYVLIFEHINEYLFWRNYFPFVSNCITSFFKIVQTDFIDRIGVRYASVLDKTGGASQVLNSVPTLILDNYIQKFENYRSIIKIDKLNLLLQIFDNAKAVKKDHNISGVYIDIDASFNEKISPGPEILDIIDKLHQEQKKLFFSLLKSEYIKTLNPKY